MLYGSKIRAEAVVCRVEDSVGMGVKFRNTSQADLVLLKRVLADMSAQGNQKKQLLPPALVVERSDAWFEHHSTLSADEYMRLRFAPAKTNEAAATSGETGSKTS